MCCVVLIRQKGNQDMIEIDSSIIDSEQLLERVRSNVLNKKDEATSQFGIFRGSYATKGYISDKEKDNYVENWFRISECIESANVNAHINIFEPITSHRKILGPGIVFFRRVIRKLIRWHIISITSQQMRFNYAVIRTLEEMNNRY